MKRLVPFFIAISSTAVIATSALAAGRDVSPGSTSAALMEQQAEEAGQAGDWTKEVALAGKSYSMSPSLLNEFNLATAYMHTGQNALAIPLYADVAANGKYTTVVAEYNYRTGPRPARVSYNLTDEANRRLIELTGQPYDLAPPVDGGANPPATP